jgi:YD repeat-containing protein
MSIRWRNTALGTAVAALMAGCMADQPVECEPVVGAEGKLCREYRYENGNSVGYVQYAYRGDTAIDLSHFDPFHSLRKTETRSYWEGQLRSVAERFADGSRVVRSYSYLPGDSLECIVFGMVDSTVCFGYDALHRRIRETHATGDTVTRSIDYRYFEDEDRLYRISFRDASDSITEYRNHIYFFDGTVRIEHFAGEHTFLGHAVEQWAPDGRLLSRRFSDTTGTVTATAEWRYDPQGRLTERISQEAFRSVRSILLYH